MTDRTAFGLVAAVALTLSELLRPAAAQPAVHVDKIFVNGFDAIGKLHAAAARVGFKRQPTT